MANVKRGVSVDSIHLGKAPSYTGSVIGAGRKLALIDALNFYNYKNKAKDHKKICIDYAKKVYDGAKLNAINACPVPMFSNTTATLITISKRGWDLNEYEQNTIDKNFEAFAQLGAQYVTTDAKEEVKVADRPNPQKRLEDKIFATIMNDLTDLEEEWLGGFENAKIDIFTLIQGHGVSGAKAAPYIHAWAQERIEEYTLALSDDKDYAEAYAYLKPAKIRNRIKILQGIHDEADRLTLVGKATRKPRKVKSKAADKQVEKVQYEKMSTKFKLTSINPVGIVGSHTLYAFNIKKRTITEFTSSRIGGFEVKGSTLLHVDESSRVVKLRDPDTFLKIVLTKTKNQINKEWGKLTTKTSVASSGRIVKDHILLRVV